MAFELKNGQGSIFKNDKKTEEKHPDYRGKIKDQFGNDWDLSLWVKTSEKGVKYFSVSCQTPYVKPTEQTITEQTNDNQPDDLPF